MSGYNGLLLTGGEGPNRKQLKAVITDPGLTVAADSGFDLALALGIIPDLLVGDLDSIKASREYRNFPRERMVVYPQDKGKTDTEIGLEILRERGCQRIILAGGGGGRLDHILGIVQLLERIDGPDIWLTSRERIEVIESILEFSGKEGEIVSFFPLDTVVRGISSTGLKWPLDTMCWERGKQGVSGISNCVTSSEVRVSVDQGRLLMIKNFLEKIDG